MDMTEDSNHCKEALDGTLDEKVASMSLEDDSPFAYSIVGNAEEPLPPQCNGDISAHHLIPEKAPDVPAKALDIVSIDHEGKHWAKALVHFGGDEQKYDSATRITVEYRRNHANPNCIENRLLDMDDVMDQMDVIYDAIDATVHSMPEFFDTVTGITIRTVNGEPTFKIYEDISSLIEYPPIPEALGDIPTVLITDIRKKTGITMDVDLVTWHGESYAFKLAGENTEGIIRELHVLRQFRDLPTVISLTAIVVDRNNHIRGFLTPYIPDGDLSSVFEKAAEKSGGEGPSLSWPTKLAWAQQIAETVDQMHAVSVLNGDIKPENILIDQAGSVKMMNFQPIEPSDAWAAPEILEIYDSHDADGDYLTVMTKAADVYSLGGLLWVIAEENPWQGVHPPVVWENETTPEWYRTIVDKCLERDPASRPFASDVVAALRRRDGEEHSDDSIIL